MTILRIYGDSFGEETMHNHPVRERTLGFRTFHADIRQSGIFEQVIVHARAGSDLWSQYQIFLETYTDNEHVIWFETDPLRFNGPDGSNFTNFANTENFLKQTQDPSIAEKCHAALDYWMYLQDEEYTNFVHAAMMNQIQAQCKHLLIIPAFLNSHSYSTAKYCLSQVSNQENQYYGVNHDIIARKYHDLRRNHMTETNHAILGRMIVDYYRTGAALDFTRFTDPVTEPLEKYFVQK